MCTPFRIPGQSNSTNWRIVTYVFCREAIYQYIMNCNIFEVEILVYEDYGVKLMLIASFF